MANNVIPIRPESGGEAEASQGHDLTLESTILWVRELEARLSRMERAMAATRALCPLAGRVPPE